MEKRGALAALALVLFLFCTEEWAAEAQCLLPPRNRPFTAPIMSQTILDEVGSTCAEGPGSAFSGCCRRINDWVNLTCACSPGSGHVVPQSILTSATDFCEVKIPQIGQCEGQCGTKQSSLEEMETMCQPDNSTGEISVASCCYGLHAFDWDCLCSPASELVLSPTIRSALTSCSVTVPQTDRCPTSPAPPSDAPEPSPL